MQMEQLLILQSHGLDCDSTGDKATWVVPQKCEIIRAVVGAQDDAAGGCTVKFDLQADGGDRGDGDIASIVFPAAAHGFEAYYDEAAQGTVLAAGNVVSVQVTASSGTAPTVSAYLICRYIPEEADNQADLLETA